MRTLFSDEFRQRDFQISMGMTSQRVKRKTGFQTTVAIRERAKCWSQK
jgi:hypothetical protein